MSKRSFSNVIFSVFLFVVMVCGAFHAQAAMGEQKKFFSLEKQRGVKVVRAIGAQQIAALDASSRTQTGSFMELKEYRRTQGVPEVKVLRLKIPSDRDMREIASLDERDKIVGSSGDFVWPIPPRYRQYISSPFGYRTHPVTGRYALHQGIDIAAAIGTPVVAAHDGVVEQIGTHPRMGRFIKVRHSANEYSYYSHLSGTTVSQGAHIAAGQQVGRVGSTGRSTGAHLDYSLRINNQPVNPMRYMSAPSNLKTRNMIAVK